MARTTQIPKPPRGESPPRANRPNPSGAGGSGARGGESSGAAAPTPSFKGNDAKLHGALVQFYGTVGMGMHALATMRGDVGMVAASVNIVASAEDTANAWVELAQNNAQVRKMLEGFIQGSAVATLVGCHVTMIVPVLSARKMVPPEVGNMMLKPEAREAASQYAAAAAAAQTNGNGQSA